MSSPVVLRESLAPPESASKAEDRCRIVHDGSFPGFLCASAEAINLVRRGSPVPGMGRASEEPGLFDIPLGVRSDEIRAISLWRRLSARAGESVLQTCHDAFCSDREGVEDAILGIFLRIVGCDARVDARGGEHSLASGVDRGGALILDDLSDAGVCLVVRAAMRTRAQAHLVTGLLRFAELADGWWYARFQSDCALLTLIGGHFASRFPGMRFAIHDTRRKDAIIHLPGRPWHIVRDFSVGNRGESGEPPFSEDENRLRACWLSYFSSVAIAERKNPRLQSGHMPKKYWNDLPEMRPRL